MARTEITLVTGARFEVDGTPEEVEAEIVAAARGSMMQLAWFTDSAGGGSLGVNPAHLVLLRATEAPA